MDGTLSNMSRQEYIQNDFYQEIIGTPSHLIRFLKYTEGGKIIKEDIYLIREMVIRHSLRCPIEDKHYQPTITEYLAIVKSGIQSYRRSLERSHKHSKSFDRVDGTTQIS